MRTSRLLAAVAVLFVSAGPSVSAAAQSLPDEGASIFPADTAVVALADGFNLTVGRFNDEYVRFLLHSGRNDTPETRRQMLDAMIETRLLAGEARRRGFDETDEFRVFETLATKRALADRVFNRAMEDSLRPLTDADVRQAYIWSQEELVLRQVFFRDPDAADAAWHRLEAGESFVDLANEVFETAGYDSAAGMLGTARYKDMSDEVAEAAFRLQTGSYSRPVRSESGWHIVRLEDRHTPPILTESDYQFRREGVAGRLRVRRNRIAGNRYVRHVMSDLDVQVAADAIRSLEEAVDRVVAEPEPDAAPRISLTREEVVGLERTLEDDGGHVTEGVDAPSLRPETVLVTYMDDGERRSFTALDFFGWLPDMEPQELRSRTASAVGRALRNEVLARRGLEKGYLDHPLVRESIDYSTGRRLADTMKQELATTERAEPTEAQIREAWHELGFRKLQRIEAEYWRIPFEDRTAAEHALAGIAAGESAPESFDGHRVVSVRDTRESDIGDLLAVMPDGARRSVCLPEGGCAAVGLISRTPHYTPMEAVRDEISAALEVLLPQVELLDRLIRERKVEVNEAIFERMMRLPQARQDELVSEDPPGNP